MKKLILSAAILLGSLSTFAQTTPDAAQTNKEQNTTENVATSTDSFTEIKMDELPTAITESLKKSHSGSVISKVYINENKQYKLVLSTGSKTETVITDANGVISEK